MGEQYTVDVKSYCPAYNTVVKLTLASSNPKDVEGAIVAGKPIYCSFQEVCGKRDDVFCMLKSLRIETKRR